MKAHYKTRSGRIVFEVEGPDPKALFRAVAELQNVFETDDRCGACQSPDIQFRVRTVDDNDYYELTCQACFARLSFGQTKKGNTLYPKRKDADGNPVPGRGWTVWEKAARTV